MEIAVLGTGAVGRALAARLDELGHHVVVGTRDPEATVARTEGDQPFSVWHGSHPGVGLATFAEAARGAELVVNASPGDVSLAVLELAGADNLAGKVLLDVANPLDFSVGYPPTLTVKDTDSLGEQVQRAHPEARVVKSLNTLNASVMADPRSLGHSTTVFVCGDDAEAKTVVTGLLQAMGHDDVIDLGGIENARGPEMYLPLWLRTMAAIGTPAFNIKVVR
ncbi:NADPH-dependent F420 reductase [Nocardioides coralli]|uniref:NADPH-dependent F420 reductase n=1 Tax=Nocardioides coralli TaxID=2872154 RepID=UPI001CA43A9E|nr:NAD(P)-binding domain-containing protein [Nocardioides coralli]QZY28432.1 NAD(P)-binding domain-containing protein [Nocardioides coralli]